ncbi:MAG: allophanate hydrolase subunit 1 [Thiobacillus sp.]|nr:allophanate hydrolase subunit 1 [Thiobacillus sp.]
MVKSDVYPSPLPPAWQWVGERGLRVETGAATLAYYESLVSQKLDEIEDVIPADGSLLVVLRYGGGVSAALRATLNTPVMEPPSLTGTLHVISAEFGGGAGPDLSELAARARMDKSTYISNCSAVEYRVDFLGFQPGFPYLSGLPEVLQVPRRKTPRGCVDAGSIAIGGRYAGIYPAAGPGGWQIIGRTSSILFDASRDPPALFLPGDRIRFVPL